MKKRLSRDDYFQKYREIGQKMFTTCITPTVGDFAKAFVDNDAEAMHTIQEITTYTGNTKDILKSVSRRTENYSEEESAKFIDSVIKANVSDIRKSGFFYKKLISSCDDVSIEIDDCHAEGVPYELPVEEEYFNFYIRDHWVMELGKYVEDFDDLKDYLGTIHVRTPLACKHGYRCFCKKCAGIFRREYDTEFVPQHFGIYATYMITEVATQAALDSMNSESGVSVNTLLEMSGDKFMDTFGIKIDSIKTIEQYKEFIRDTMLPKLFGSSVESRFYEVALLSRWRKKGKKYIIAPLVNSFTFQEDVLGSFIYQPNQTSFDKFLLAGEFNANSMKTRIAFDKYDD